MMGKLFAITYGIMVFKFHINGKMNNIKTLKKMKMKIKHKHLMMLSME